MYLYVSVKRPGADAENGVYNMLRWREHPSEISVQFFLRVNSSSNIWLTYQNVIPCTPIDNVPNILGTSH